MPHHYFGASIILLDEDPSKLISMEGLHGGRRIDSTKQFMTKIMFLAVAYALKRQNDAHIHFKDWSPMFKQLLDSTFQEDAFVLFLTLFCNGLSFDKEDVRFAASVALCTDIQLVEISGNNATALQLTCSTWDLSGKKLFDEWTTAFEGAQVIRVKQNGGIVAGLKSYYIPYITLNEKEEVQIKPTVKNVAYFFAPSPTTTTLKEIVGFVVKRKEGESMEEAEARKAAKLQRIIKELNTED